VVLLPPTLSVLPVRQNMSLLEVGVMHRLQVGCPRRAMSAEEAACQGAQSAQTADARVCLPSHQCWSVFACCGMELEAHGHGEGDDACRPPRRAACCPPIQPPQPGGKRQHIQERRREW